MTQKTTLRDVAALAGVHYGTASRALRPDTAHLVSPRTVARVRDAASKLRYTPDVIAQSLRTSRTSTVGVVIPDIANPITGSMTRGVQDVLTTAGYVSLVLSTDHDPEHERHQISALLSRQVDGLIVANADSPTSRFEDIAERGIALVLANRGTDARLTTVNAAVGAGIDAAVEHLVSLGHRRIAFIGASRDPSTGRGRHLSFEESVAARGLAASSRDVRFSESFGLADGSALMRELLTDGTGHTAVITGNDVMAIGAIAAVRDAGLHCPSDISIVGINDMQFVEFLDPSLTTIHVPHHEIGRAAAEALLAKLAGETPSSVVLPVEFVVRGSTAAPHAA